MADLKEVRRIFIETTGLYDLIVGGDISSNVDNGANAVINAGQDYLDKLVEHPKLLRRHMVKLTQGQFKISIQRVISIRHIFVINAEGRSDITKNILFYDQFRQEFGDLMKDWDTGEPKWWCPNIIGLSPEQMTKTSTNFTNDGILDFDDITFGDEFAADGILFNPKADGTYTIEVVGEFLSRKLVDDTDTSFWTVKYPDLLALSGNYIHERRMRNAQGMETALAAMQPELDEIDNAMVRFELAGLNNKMGG
jgi:hypothetical protein